MNTRPAKPANAAWIAPYLTVRDVEGAIEFYARAFGFETRLQVPGPDGKTSHAEMVWQESPFMLGGEGPNHECRAPVSMGSPSPVSLYVYCADVDALHARAVREGAVSKSEPQEMFWGDRMCTLADPDGHVWHFATNVAEFDPSKAPK